MVFELGIQEQPEVLKDILGGVDVLSEGIMMRKHRAHLEGAKLSSWAKFPVKEGEIGS